MHSFLIRILLILVTGQFFLQSKLVFAVDIPYKTYGFFDQQAKEKKVKLKVIAKVVEVENNKKGLMARLFQSNLTNKGEKLYILNRSGLIIGEIKVKYIFTTLYFGQMLKGTGFFRLIPNGSRVAKEIREDTSEDEFLIARFIGNGENFFHDNSIGNAIKYYKKALSIEPNNPKALLNLAKCYINQKLWKIAEKYLTLSYKYRQNLKVQDDKLELFMFLADIHMKKAKNRIEIGQKDIRGYKKQVKAALVYIKKGLQISPDSAFFNYQGGRLEYLMGRDRYALDYFKRTIEKGGQYLFNSYWTVAKIFKKRGMKERALKYYKKARRINPYNQKLRFEINKLKG